MLKSPLLVVAPIRVKWGSLTLKLFALVPSPTFISTKKSSIAEYKTSSTTVFNLWISSINNISFSPKVVNIEAKSPGLSITGADVDFILLPSSFAIIWARVVFPKPGGP